jgi:hypothetical protein
MREKSSRESGIENRRYMIAFPHTERCKLARRSIGFVVQICKRPISAIRNECSAMRDSRCTTVKPVGKFAH